MNFGYTVEAIDAGINFFDTANVYGGPQSPVEAGVWHRGGDRRPVAAAQRAP
jgi:aryl-alcohol dehydrogenase-like predicted oxidoreductase